MENKIKLHLGCGWRDFGKSWTHIDGGDYDHLDYSDITKLPFKDNTVSLIYASHVLEYFDREEVISVLKEWNRVLLVGGTLRLAVPDFYAMTQLYYNEGYGLEEFLGPIFGKMSMGDETIYHKTTYDFVSLKKLLDKCCFNNILRWDWRDTEHSKFDDHSQAYKPHMNKKNGKLISLNVFCVKI